MNQPATCPECGKPLPAGSAHDLCPACLMGQVMASRTVNTAAGDETAVPPPSPEEIAGKFPQFEVVECLGRGGMGVVYKARQKSLDRWVAIKVLAPGRVQEERFAEHFEREAKTLARMSHPNIVTVFDHGKTDGLFYIVMEFVDGLNLRDLLREGKMEPEQALAIVPQICEALEYAHDKGVVHRDIKPENVLLDREGRVKIADFGIASLVGAQGEKSGTPPYMAPEQEKGIVDRRADIYALGVVLYEMLTGERPNQELVAPSKKVQIDVRLDEIVLRALEKAPALRYQTAGEFRTMLETMAATPSSPGPNPAKELATRVGESLYATPEFLATTWGSMKLHEGMASLALYSDRLVVGRGWQTTTIPFGALRKLSVVKYPRCLSPSGLHSILVEYEEADKLKRLLLTPRNGFGIFSSTSKTNQSVAEWFLAIREAVSLASGQPPAGSATPEPYQGLSSEGILWAKLLWVFNGMAGLGALGFLIFEGRNILGNPHVLPGYLGMFVFGMAFIFLIVRSQRKQWQRDNPLPPTAVGPGAASAGSSNHRVWWIGGPFQSPEVSEISDHLTKPERQEVLFYGILAGLWFCLTIWGSVWVIRNFPGPDGWIVAAILVASYIASQPVWLRMQRKFLCSTQWAKASGYTPDKLKLFSPPFATGTNTRKSAQPEQGMESRFSRTAIQGAFFAVLCMSAMILQIKVVGIAATAVVSTILGWIAVTEIRRSARKLHGMWLAVFDGLLFPLLALVFVGMKILALPVELFLRPRAAHDETARYLYHDAPLIIFIPIIVLILFLVGLIIRRVWRAVNSNNSTAPQQTGSPEKPARFSRKAILAAAYVCMALSFAVLFAKQWNERKREGEWVPARISNTITQQYGEAQVRVVDVSQVGQVVVVSFICEMFRPDHELRVQYGGPVLSCPNDLTSSVNAKVMDLDCLIVPRAKIIDDNIGEVLAGTNVLSDRAMFRVGFVLPDAQTAAQVVKQVQEVLLGKPHGIGGDKSVLLLFSLHRDFGKDAAGNSVAEALDASLWLRPKSAASQPRAQTVFDLQPVIELTIPMNENGETDMLDPETGQIIPSPNRDGSQASRKGLLIQHDAKADKTVLVGMNGVIPQESRADQWAEITNFQALETLKNNFMSKGGSVGAGVNGPAPHTFLFKTGNGRIGILQITRFIEIPRGVEVRYKMVQPSRFIRWPGTFPLDDAGSIVLTPSIDGKVSLAVTMVEGTSIDTCTIPDFCKQEGWFVYIESPKRVWIFDGIRQLALMTPGGIHNAGDPAIRALCPQVVWDAVPESVCKLYREAQVNGASRDMRKPLSQEEISHVLEQLRQGKNVYHETLHRALISDQAYLRATAARLLGEVGDATSVPHLIDALSDQSVHVGAEYPDAGMATTRYWAHDSLKKLTKQDFSFVWNAPESERLAAINRWKQYAKTNTAGTSGKPEALETNFQKVQKGMSREEIERMLGKPAFQGTLKPKGKKVWVAVWTKEPDSEGQKQRLTVEYGEDDKANKVMQDVWEADEPAKKDPPLSKEAQAVLDGLNLKAADPAWQSEFDMIERPETRPPNTKYSGEVTAFLSDSKKRLKNLGVRAVWNASTKRYEVAAEAKDDPIGRLTQKLNDSHGRWLNGGGPEVDLPPTASSDEVLLRIISRTGLGTNVRTLEVRNDCPIYVSYSEVKRFTAALVEVDSGKRIIFFNQQAGQWWSRVYDLP